MAHPAVDKFGELLICQLRDPSLEHLARLVDQQDRAPSLIELQRKLAEQSGEVQNLIRACVVSCVDAGLHSFLFGLSEAHDQESGVAVVVDGVDIAEASDGLQGEPYSDQGWINRFSAFGEAGIASEQ